MLALHLGIATLVTTAPSPVHAAGSASAASDEDPVVAERRLAAALFREERYEESLQHWLRAYEMLPLPRVHYNIAKCYRKLNRPQDELHALELFSATDPEKELAPEQHAEAKGRIAELHQQLDPKPREYTPVHKRWWFWTLIGTATAGVAAGITGAVVVGTQGQSAADMLTGVQPERPAGLTLTYRR